MNKPLRDYPVNTDATNPPPAHYVRPFDPDAFRRRMELRQFSAEYDRDWHQKRGCSNPNQEQTGN